MIVRLLRAPGPVLLAVAAAVIALHGGGVGGRQILCFLLLQLVGYVVPGMLLWRWLGRRPGSLLRDATLGTILAHAATVLVYIAARAIGVPQLVWFPPLVVIALFLLVRPLRIHWRTPADQREPAWFTWCLAVGVALLCLWFSELAIEGPMADPALRWQAADYAYLLSLAGEAHNHMPPTVPFVVGERLDYHWFAFADVAAMSWQGGGDLAGLLFRLMPLWCLINAFLAFGLLAERMAGRKIAGALAVIIAVLVGSVTLIHNAGTYVSDSTLLMVNWGASQTQGFGQLLAMALLYVMVGILRGSARGWRPWLLFGVLSVAMMGAKATFIPVIGAGVALLVVVELIRRRGVPWTALAVGAALAVELAFAQIVLFGGARQGIVFAVGADSRRLSATVGVPATTSHLALATVVIALVFGWLVPLAGAALLAVRLPARRRGPSPIDPIVVVLTGMVVAGVVAVVVLAQPGFSEYFFLRSGLPFGYLLVAVGLARLGELGVPRSAWVWLALSGAGGAAYVGLCRLLTRHPLVGPSQARLVLLLIAGAIVVAALAGLLGRVAGARLARPGGAALAMACLAVATLGMGAVRAVDFGKQLPRPAFDASTLSPGSEALPAGGVAAARYVRDHSGTDDLFATNAHCVSHITPACDARAFWMSAYAERRAVVEGWGYTSTANKSAPITTAAALVPYWDSTLLTINDAVFRHPSREALARLMRLHPVRWLIVDTRFPVALPALRRLLPTGRRFGQTWVFPTGGA